MNVSLNFGSTKSSPKHRIIYQKFGKATKPEGELKHTSREVATEENHLLLPARGCSEVNAQGPSNLHAVDFLRLDSQLAEWDGIQRVITTACAHGRTLAVLTAVYRMGSWSLMDAGSCLIHLDEASQDALRKLASQSLSFVKAAGVDTLHFCRAGYSSVMDELSNEYRIEAVLAMLPRVRLQLYDGEDVAHWSAKSSRSFFQKYAVEGRAQARAASLARLVPQRMSRVI